MTLEQVRDRWFLWLLAEELKQLPCVVAVSELYRRRIAGDKPTVEEWRAAYSRTDDAAADARAAYARTAYARTDDAAASARAAYAAYAAVYAAAADAAVYAASAAAAVSAAYADFYADAAASSARAAAASASAVAADAYAGSECWRRMASKLVELLGEQLPRFPDLHKVILDRITPANFDMERWHCGTTHCRAGHAIDAAGPAGYALERVFGPKLAAAAIYFGNTGMLPNFHASDDDALADIRKCANGAL